MGGGVRRMRARELGRAAAVGAVLLAVAGCNTTVQEQLGMGKRSPDEFQVVQRAPLIVPPDSTLRPPEPGAVPPAQQDVTAEARDILTGEKPATPVPTDASLSPGERDLLTKSPVQASPDIRGKIVAENRELTQLDRRTFLYILKFQKKQFEPQDQVLDPKVEMARLRGQAQPGDVVTVHTGSTPIPAS
jgi:Protein of unknown function (DUF3035)